MNWLLKKVKGDPVIWGVVVMLSLVSLLAVYSSTGSLAFKQKGGNTEFYLFKQLLFIGMGLGMMWLAHMLDYRYYSRISQMLLYLSYPLLVYTLFFGVEINNAVRWMEIPGTGLTFQTSDLAKLALIMYLARFLSKRQDTIHIARSAFLPLLGAIVGICVLIAPANLSTALVLFSTCLLLMFLGRIPLKFILAVVASGIIFFTLVATLVMKMPEESIAGIARLSTWKSRIENFMGDEENINGRYQNIQAKIAIAKGGLLGQGPGNSVQRNFLPEAYSDFIYAIILEEYGLVGGVGLILLYLLLLYRSIRIVVRSPKAFGALLAVGLSFSLVIQAFINMAVAVNIFPVTGLALPLISMGGTSTLFTSIAIGIILSVSRFSEPEEEDGFASEDKGKEKGGNFVPA
ncbi:MAG TPA: cell division protein FtsW [Bacteroidetes bacterium]|nr:cell division protein FtsW [Bacteroidota bacterium]